MEVGESLHCHHQNDSCIKMGRDESHFNFPSIVRDKVTRQCPLTTIFEEKGEPKRIRTEVPRLVSRGTSVRIRFGSPFSSKVVVCGHCITPSYLLTYLLTPSPSPSWYIGPTSSETTRR